MWICFVSVLFVTLVIKWKFSLHWEIIEKDERYLYFLKCFYCFMCFKGYRQQPIAFTQCFMGWTQSSDGFTMQYLSVLKTKIHESLLQCITHFKHEYWILQA